MSSWKEKAASGALAAQVASNIVTGHNDPVEQLGHATQSQNEARMEQTAEAAAAQAPAVQVQAPPSK
jgi:hypothetical protein